MALLSEHEESIVIVNDIMTAPVISVEPSTTVAEAAKLMLAHRISGLPVANRDGALVGMISEGDLLRRSELGTERKRPWWLEFLVGPGRTADEYIHSHGRTVEKVMTTEVVTTQPGASLGDVVDAMSRRRIKRLPVVENGRLVGLVARSDVLRALAQALPTARPVVADDEQIRTAVLAEIAKQGWGGGLIRVQVHDGAVELVGTICDERERLAAHVAAENTPGVKSVSDELVWIEPISGLVVLPAAEGETPRDFNRKGPPPEAAPPT